MHRLSLLASWVGAQCADLPRDELYLLIAYLHERGELYRRSYEHAVSIIIPERTHP